MATLKYFDMLSQTWKYASTAQQSYVDAQAALKVSKAGDTMTGALHMPAGIALRWAGADKMLYTDDTLDALYVLNLAGGLSNLKVASPAAADDATTKAYVEKRIQSGNAWSTIAPASVTFPVAFSGLPTSIVITAIAGSVTAAICSVRSSSASGFTFSVVNQADTYVEVQVFWMAIGAVA